MTANERDSRVTVVYGYTNVYISEGGDSVVTTFPCEAAKQLAKARDLLLAK